MSPRKTSPKLTQTDITASFSGTLTTGSYSNEKPMFSIKETWVGSVDDKFINERHLQLHERCRDKFKEVEKLSHVDKIRKQREDIRFYEFNNDQYPSVTSVLSWDSDFHIDAQDLQQYASRGTIIHKQVELFLQTGKWMEPRDITDIYSDYIIVKRGSLKLSLDDVNFQGFYKKYPFKVINTEQTVYNTKHKYAGTADIKGKIGDKVTLFDVKAVGTLRKLDYLAQISAYAKCEGNEDVEQICIIHLNKNTKQGFSQPVLETNIDKYFNYFLEKRKHFKQRFGV